LTGKEKSIKERNEMYCVLSNFVFKVKKKKKEAGEEG
jgi:hypothetical protein